MSAMHRHGTDISVPHQGYAEGRAKTIESSLSARYSVQSRSTNEGSEHQEGRKGAKGLVHDSEERGTKRI